MAERNRGEVEQAAQAGMEARGGATLARALECTLTEPGWPDFNPDEEQALIDQYASSEWIEAR